MAKMETDICVIGAGSGGLSLAAGATQLGIKVTLIEQNKMGGECLNSGCIPSKAFISAAHAAKAAKNSKNFGINIGTTEINYRKIHNYVQKIIENIAPNDSKERFQDLGVNVINGSPKFINKRELTINNTIVRARYFVIATGSSPAVPPIPGLDGTPFLTNETIFQLKEKPEHLIVIGGGPIGSELAHAYRLLGTKVSLIQRSTILNKDDLDIVEVVKKQFTKDGISLYEESEMEKVEYKEKTFSVTFKWKNKNHEISGSHLLVASGRKPNIDNLDLEKAGVKYNDRKILINSKTRSTNRRIFAIGDVTGRYQFTHIANYQAGVVLRNILFRIPTKENYRAIPWAIFTSPEIAHVGLNEKVARIIHKKIRILKTNFTENDRANTEDDTTGLIKVIVTRRGHILGVSIVGNNASELLYPWILAISQKLKIKSMATPIVPYPTRSEISKKVAGEFFKPMLFSKITQKIVKFLIKLTKL